MSLLNKFRKNENKKDLKEGIFENICDILNTKKGFGTYQNDFGLDSCIYFGTNKNINKKILEDIKNCVEKFETRIKIEEVLSIPNASPFFMSFLIKCKIENAPHSFQISFHHQKQLFEQETSS